MADSTENPTMKDGEFFLAYNEDGEFEVDTDRDNAFQACMDNYGGEQITVIRFETKTPVRRIVDTAASVTIPETKEQPVTVTVNQ